MTTQASIILLHIRGMPPCHNLLLVARTELVKHRPSLWYMYIRKITYLGSFCGLQSGSNLAEEKPENKPEIDERLEKLNIKWQELAAASKQKGNKLGDAKKQVEFNAGVKNIEGWITELETTTISTEKATDLTTATRLYQKHKVRKKPFSPNTDQI